MKTIHYFLILCLSSTMLLSSCDEDGDINIFTIQDDKKLGQQLRDEILNSPDEYNIIDRADNPQAYNYVEEIVQEILNTGKVRYKDEFPWEVYLIKDDSTLNAFCAPGGYIFVYSGIIKFLDEKDAFVGVMGHEMAHADLRHSTEQLTKAYGVTTLLNIALGKDDNTLIKQVLSSLLSLKFSRNDEAEADKQSVIYLCGTQYAANGAAAFFEKLEAAGTPTPPEFLSTHPSPEHRIEDINKEAEERDCDTTYNSSQSEWREFQNSL